MVVQVYKDIENDRIIMVNKSSYSYNQEQYVNFELLEEIEGEDWSVCNKQISEKYFNSKSLD